MIVISDTNIIFSCFYTPNGAMATILKNEKNRLQFIAPSYLLEEVKEHLPILMERNHLTKKKALDILKEATKNITFYDLEEIKKKNREKAAEIAKDIDPDDYLFIALHFETGHKIWTCDAKLANGLKEKGYDMCITTNEIREKTYKKKEQNFSPIREDFFKQKIVWKAVGRNLAFSILEEGKFVTAPASFITSENSLYYILGFLCSSFAKYFIYNNSDTTGAGDIMLNIQSIVKIPIPHPSINNQEEVENIISEIIAGKKENINTIFLENKLDEIINNILGLSPEEIDFIKSF